MQNNFSHKVVNKKNTSIQFDDNSRVIPNKSPSSCVLWLALPFAFYVRSPFVQRGAHRSYRKEEQFMECNQLKHLSDIRNMSRAIS